MTIERESDGIGELTEDLLRVAILIGTRLAQRHAQQRAHRLEQAARQSEQAREREERIQALERDAALGSLSGVRWESWWDHADVDDIRRAWTTAREWRGQDPRADEVVYRMADELHNRYGLDVRETDPSILGQQPQLPEHTTLTAEELAAYDQRLHEQIERLAEQHAPLSDDHPLDPAGQQPPARGPAADTRVDRAAGSDRRGPRRTPHRTRPTRARTGGSDKRPASSSTPSS